MATGREIARKAAKQLGILKTLTGVTAGAKPVYACPTLSSFAVDDQAFVHWFAINDTGDNWQQTKIVVDTDVSAGTLTTDANFTSDPNTLDLVQYLRRSDWLDCLNEALPRLYYKARASVTLAAGDSEYNVSANNTWLTRENQILAVRFRNTADATNPIEGAVAEVRFFETDGALTMRLPGFLPADIDNTTVVIEARHYHSELTSPTNNIVALPADLVVAEVKWEALKKIFIRLGPTAKKMYGQAMVLAERDVTELEAKFQTHTVARDWHGDENLGQAVDPTIPINWTW